MLALNLCYTIIKGCYNLKFAGLKAYFTASGSDIVMPVRVCVPVCARSYTNMSVSAYVYVCV